MRTLREKLTAGDPVASEPPADEREVQRIRGVMLDEATGRRPRHRHERLIWMATGAVAVAVTIAALVRQPGPPLDGTATPLAVWEETRSVATRRQLQFVTAGGTRIIWIFNEGLDLERQR
jgi:hypothetical protein